MSLLWVRKNYNAYSETTTTKGKEMFKFNKDPIHVVVYASRWDSYGKPGSFRAHYLFELLKRNGISDSVEPGHYVFNAIRKGLKLELSLTPASSWNPQSK